ncbi:hypothetical protein [Aquimarina algiphila]|uniref:Type II secretion system protein GspC N-terminal domain-containing protein n=1 Tax=Aquimarina algiphila TaxID=2047982 RepID=A0A554VGX0_9FLAO|nr:hypothetical protein [Aquimarina algiphila]TSE06680.1 hypothetical protein FOF46_18405 [Aquimarina algiphila]
MLKGKKALYILLPLVALIWGAIIVQVVDAFSDDDPVSLGTTSVDIKPLKTKEREKFTLGIVERDPFLGTLYQPKKKESKPRSRVKKVDLVWPSIRYKGVVSGQNSAKAIYLIEINGTDQLMNLRQTIDGITLQRGKSSSVLLRYKGKTKDFKITN